jgi:hypothetical protein
MGEFQAILLEGLFFLSANPNPDSQGVVRPGFNDLIVQTPTGERSVYATLRPLVGQRVYFAAHHVPSEPIDASRWGGGSCHWQPASGHQDDPARWQPTPRCPFGHHEHPTRLLNLVAQGVLAYDFDHATCTGGWWVDCADGSRVILPWLHLVGHTARVAAATMMAAEQMRDAAMASGMDVEGLGTQVADLRDLVMDLSRIVKRT